MDTSILEDIGLTGAEIKVFLTLLELGSSTAGAVVEKSGLQNAVVHRAFHSLTEKGLITYVLEGKTKSYQPIEPKLLLNFIDEKKERLKKLLPELEKRRSKLKKKPRATIYQGIRGIKELLNLLLETDSKKYAAYGGSEISKILLGEHFWEGFHRKRTEKGIKARLIFHASLKKWAKHLRSLKLATIRITNTDFEEITETFICGDRVAIIVFLEKPFGFLIEEPNAANSYKKFFEILWKSST
jgi:sugar-specific transcriptional regulator TrmB